MTHTAMSTARGESSFSPTQRSTASGLSRTTPSRALHAWGSARQTECSTAARTFTIAATRAPEAPTTRSTTSSGHACPVDGDLVAQLDRPGTSATPRSSSRATCCQNVITRHEG
jgi:hypothetical protein